MRDPAISNIAPDYIGANKLDLSLTDPTTPARAFSPVSVTVDYAACDPAGVVLPVELLITAPTVEHFVRKVYRRVSPSEIVFTPREGGTHHVLLREIAHNRWWGNLVIAVEGDPMGTT